MTKCDNPACGEVTDDLYGWITGCLTYVGHGPSVTIEVCSSACLERGLDGAEARARQEEYEQAEKQARETTAAILAIDCDVCAAEDGLPCVAKSGKIKQDFHASRRKRGIEQMKDTRTDA